MRAITALTSQTLPYQALDVTALQQLAERDLGAAIALGEREARRVRAEVGKRALRQAWHKVVSWPGRSVRLALHHSH